MWRVNRRVDAAAAPTGRAPQPAVPDLDQALSGALRGDPESFRVLYGDTQPRVLRYLLTGLLESLRGTQEWGVQVYLQPGVGEAVPAGATVSGLRGGLELQQPWLEAEAAADQIDRVLSDIAVVSRRQPAPYLRPGSVCGWMVLNGIYLLDADQAAEFSLMAKQFASEHATLRVEVTGPWPPYSFADRDDA